MKAESEEEESQNLSPKPKSLNEPLSKKLHYCVETSRKDFQTLTVKASGW